MIFLEKRKKEIKQYLKIKWHKGSFNLLMITATKKLLNSKMAVFWVVAPYSLVQVSVW
jgi:hypothetical protein